MLLSIPRTLFKGESSVIDPVAVEGIRRTLSSRYPWLSEGAIDEVLIEARQARIEEIEVSKSTVQRCTDLVAARRFGEAARILEDHLLSEPDDSDAWQLRGEALCKLGRVKEGYESMAKARRKRLTSQRRGDRS